MKLPEEAEEFYKVAQALLINIGTLTAENEQDIMRLLKRQMRQAYLLYLTL